MVAGDLQTLQHAKGNTSGPQLRDDLDRREPTQTHVNDMAKWMNTWWSRTFGGTNHPIYGSWTSSNQPGTPGPAISSDCGLRSREGCDCLTCFFPAFVLVIYLKVTSQLIMFVCERRRPRNGCSSTCPRPCPWCFDHPSHGRFQSAPVPTPRRTGARRTRLARPSARRAPIRASHTQSEEEEAKKQKKNTPGTS